MQVKTTFLAMMAVTGISKACYFTVHSSTVGDFKAQHSEPKDHGGAAQTITGSSGACSFSGQLFDGCTVSVTSNKGCGTLTFTRIGTD